MEYKNTIRTIIGITSLLSILTTNVSCMNNSLERDRKINAITKLTKEKYNLIKEKNIKVIKTNNIEGKSSYHLVKALTPKELYNLSNEYDCFKDSAEKYSMYYIDIFNAEVISIEYIHIEKRNTEIVVSTLINEILEENNAIDYASVFYGLKEEYTYEELEEMINNLNYSYNKIR